MADAYTTFATMANDAISAYIANKMIDLADRVLVMDKIADPYSLPQKMSKTLRVVQVARLALPNAPLGEGITPATLAMTLSNVDVTVEQWGIVVALTDVLELTVTHPMVSIASERVTMALKEAAERDDANVLMAATNVTYPGVVTTRGGLAATDVFNTALAITINAKLEMRGAPKFLPDGNYMGLFQPPHKAAILGSDTTFQNASAYSQINNLKYGYIGPWMGIDWTMGNFLPVFIGVTQPDTAANTATKAQYTVGLAGTLATANYQIKVVAREVATDYERRLSVQTGNIAVTTPGSISVKFPTSTNYVYDLYMTQAGGTVAYLVASRQAANSTYTIITAPAGTETVAPVSPALNIPVYPGFVVGKGAFGCVMLNGMSLQTFVTPPTSSDSDPLRQRRKIGAKWMRKCWILEQAFVERFETSSSLAPVIPA